MSLINDALKRATQSPASSPTAPAPQPKTPMQPVDYQNRANGLPWYFLPVVLLILAGSCWFVVKGIQGNRAAAPPLAVQAREPQPAPSAGAPAETTFATEAALPVDTSSAQPAAIPNRNFSLDDAPPAGTAPPTPAPDATATPVETTKPAFRLQGIFYRTVNPSAMVNGKNVNIGSRIGAATVKSITRDSVTLEADGQTTVLTLD